MIAAIVGGRQSTPDRWLGTWLVAAFVAVIVEVDARKLEEAGYVSCEKTFSGRTPRTEYTLTASGRRALEKYLDHMDAIIRAARNR